MGQIGIKDVLAWQVLAMHPHLGHGFLDGTVNFLTPGSPFSAVCSRVAYSDQERPWRSYLLPAGEGAPQGRMRDEMLALVRKFPSSGRSGPTPQAGFPPLPAGEGEDVPPRLQLNGKMR